jgi:lipopolysaccharide export system protein LptC
MALSEPWQSAAATPRPMSERQRRRRAFHAARRHSRLVRRLRIFLPAAGTCVVVAFFVLTRLSLPEGLDLSAARLSVTPSAIIMERPHLKGFDRRNQEYSVEAERAVQAMSNPNVVRLENITATLGNEAEGQTRVESESGDYDRSAGTLKLHGAIAIDSPDGYSVTMTDADLDLKAGTLVSPNPTKVVQGTHTTTGNRLSVVNEGEVIRLEGGVHTTILPAKRQAAPVKADEEHVSQ